MTSLIKIQNFKVGKNNNYVSKVLEAALQAQYKNTEEHYASNVESGQMYTDYGAQCHAPMNSPKGIALKRWSITG